MIEVSSTFLLACWSVFGAMAPYLLLGFAVAGLLSVFVSPEWVERHLGGSRLGQIFKASLFGVPLPLCSCGVLPVSASLRRHGAGKGATTAFLLSTPQTGVDSIMVTYALLGPFLAVFRPLAALITGFIGGGLVHVLDGNGNGIEPAAAANSNESAATTCSDSQCCGDQAGQQSRWLRALHYGFITLPRDIGKALILGVLISGVISALVEPNTLRAYLGGGLWPLIVAMAIGIPLYVCATASVPIAVGLIHAGLSPGAAIAFLISGPATNGAALATLWKILGRRTALIYLVTVAVGAVVAGVAVDAFIDVGSLPVSAVMGEASAHHGQQHAIAGAGIGSWVENASAVVLLLVLVVASWPRAEKQDADDSGEHQPAQQQSLDLKVKGMRCNGCVQSLDRALAECGGVHSVSVSLERGSVSVRGSGFDAATLETAVVDLGFEVLKP